MELPPVAFLTSATLVFVPQIELEEQRRSGRGRSKDKRKRKSHRNDCGEKGGQRSPEASESKKTCPTSHGHSLLLPVTLHPEVNSPPPLCLLKGLLDLP